MGKRRESVVVEKRRRGLEGRVSSIVIFFSLPSIRFVWPALAKAGLVSRNTRHNGLQQLLLSYRVILCEPVQNLSAQYQIYYKPAIGSLND